MKASYYTYLFGIMTIFGLMIQGCFIEEENISPTASFTISPSSGNLQTVFVFDASGCADVEDATADLLIRWDFNGDGVWDTDWIIEKQYSIQYIDISTYITKLEVKDTQGATAQTTQSVDVIDGGGTGTATDPRDGYTYATETIGGQTWFSENLKYQSRGSWCYDNDPSNCATYGRLYDWASAMDACPNGWHLPSDAEWKQIEMQLGMSQTEADGTGFRGTDEAFKMKSISGWHNNYNGNNSSGFNVLPAGYYFDGDFYELTEVAQYWSGSKDGLSGAFSRSFHWGDNRIVRNVSSITSGQSVRCVKN